MQVPQEFSPRDLFEMYLYARRPIIYIRSFDFQSVDRLIEGRCAEVFGKDYYIEEFSEANGVVNFKTKTHPDGKPRDLAGYLSLFDTNGYSKGHFLVVLREVHDSLADKRVYSLLQAIARRVQISDDDHSRKKYDVTVVIVDSKLAIPPELERIVSVLEISPPCNEEITAIIREVAKNNDNAPVVEECLPEYLSALHGISEFEIKQILNLILGKHQRFGEEGIPLIHQEKRQAIQKSGLLEMVETGEKIRVGGLKTLRNYLAMNKLIFRNSELARKHGIDIPAGIMIIGMPGCGKSLTAKFTAGEFGVPLLRLDVGRLMGKFVGESEENLRRAIRVAESAAPCVLWIDEIEKAFAGIGDSGGGGVTTRMFGYFLTWMQEKKSRIFVVATANDISNLPPEFLRRGRFDEIFQVKFPNRRERSEIFDIQIRKRSRDGQLPAGISPERLAELLPDEENFSGADIESIVKEAMKRLFVRNCKSGLEESQWQELSQDDLETLIKDEGQNRIRSSYHSQKEKLDKMLDKLRTLDVKSAT